MTSSTSVIAIAMAVIVGGVPGLAAGQERLRTARVQGFSIQALESAGSSIGVAVRDLTAEEASRAGGSGVFIDRVENDTPAARAGFRSGDIVLEFDGERVRSARQFTRLVRETRAGRSVAAVVLRDGMRLTLNVVPETRRGLDALPEIRREIDRLSRTLPRRFSIDPDSFAWRFEAVGSPRRLGATLSPLGDQLAQYFGVKDGVLVASVDADSPAARAGLRAGDVITSVGGRSVSSPADVAAEVWRARPGSNLELRVVRDRKELTVTVAIPERPASSTRRGLPV